MKNFWKLVNTIIKEADLILLVGDARSPLKTYNTEIIDKIKKQNKKFLYILNKADLIKKNQE